MKENNLKNTYFLAYGAVIAAIYVALTMAFQPISFVSQFLRTSHAAYPQPACNLGAEKLAAVPPDLQYIVEIHPGTASVVPLRSGGKK